MTHERLEWLHPAAGHDETADRRGHRRSGRFERFRYSIVLLLSGRIRLWPEDRRRLGPPDTDKCHRIDYAE
jgi:hypothetical protein